VSVVLLIDNYDSFVWNLARYVAELGREPVVRRHDAILLEEIAAMAPSHVILSPGPCTPREAGISVDVVRRFGPTLPLLGVCLGHQCIAVACGGRVAPARHPMHGRTSAVTHDGQGLFAGLPSPFRATRYHSLAVAAPDLPADLRITARADDGEIMAIAHVTHPVAGVQFHPEALLTEHGYALLENFLRTASPR
jgi:anthranilate synthase/aminodeoxychorismate synthase-like glutamine amidotransferase